MTEDDGLLFEPARDVADDWDGPGTAPSSEAALYLELDGWEGPLDLLLDLARRQKVDLKQISILALVDQYIAYIERAEALRLEIAADYLVMAAWLAYLKSAMLGVKLVWMELRDFLPVGADPRLTRSALASSFVAAQARARLGKAEIRQEEVFGPMHLRRVPA